MSYAARRGATSRASTACLGGLLLSLFASGCSGNGDPGTDAGTDGTFRGDATLGEWEAVPVAGTLCRNGAPTGYAINVNPSSRKLLIFMEGGGACFNDLSCRQNPDSWVPNDASLAQSLTRNWIMSRSSTNSPFRDWNLVYIPYCSGDVHTGTTMSGYMGQPQVGFLNYKKDLADFVPKFSGLDQVVLAGVSAGGFGVAWNWLTTQDAFPSVPVYAIDDSGPPMGPDYLSECQQQRYGALWGWAGNINPVCTSCDPAAGRVVRPLMDATFAKSKSTRFGLLSYDEDGTIKSFFAYGTDNCANWDSVQPPIFPMGMYPVGLSELRQEWSAFPQAAMYVVSGASHTFLGNDIASVKTGPAIPMLEWIKRLIDKSDGWTNVAP